MNTASSWDSVLAWDKNVWDSLTFSLLMENMLDKLERKNVGWTMFKGVFKPGVMEHDTVLQRALERLEKK